MHFDISTKTSSGVMKINEFMNNIISELPKCKINYFYLLKPECSVSSLLIHRLSFFSVIVWPGVRTFSRAIICISCRVWPGPLKC